MVYDCLDGLVPRLVPGYEDVRHGEEDEGVSVGVGLGGGAGGGGGREMTP